jgi:putative tryptophan/tyrosine transport system substrate-binding protein
LANHIRRREFIFTLGGTVAAWPLAARAQQAMPVVGFLSSGFPNAYLPFLAAFHTGLSESGYIEGKNLKFEYRWAEGQFERLPPLAADLIHRSVAVVVTSGVASGLAAKAVNSTIPHIFLSQDDPVKRGFVAGLNRPGGNATGVALLTSVLVKKRLELVRQLVPTAAVITVLANPNSPEAESQLTDVQLAAGSLGQEIHLVNAASDGDFDSVFATLSQQRSGAFLVTTDPLFYSRRYRIVALAIRHAIPTIYDRREFATVGGLITYGANFLGAYRQIGIYTGRVLKGAKPAELPVMQPTNFELVINLATAKAIGLTVPPTLLARADEVIE